MNLACTKRDNKGVGKMVMAQIDTVMEMDVNMIEENIQNCLLLIPLIIDENFVQEYAIIYHDGEVNDINHENKLPDF